MLDRCRARARAELGQDKAADRPANWLAAVVVALWLLVAALLVALAWKTIGG